MAKNVFLIKKNVYTKWAIIQHNDLFSAYQKAYFNNYNLKEHKLSKEFKDDTAVYEEAITELT